MLHFQDHAPIPKAQFVQPFKLLVPQFSVINDLLLLVQEVHQIRLLLVCQLHALHCLGQILYPAEKMTLSAAVSCMQDGLNTQGGRLMRYGGPQTHSMLFPTPEMNPPSGLSDACASEPPIRIGGGFAFAFFSDMVFSLLDSRPGSHTTDRTADHTVHYSLITCGR